MSSLKRKAFSLCHPCVKAEEGSSGSQNLYFSTCTTFRIDRDVFKCCLVVSLEPPSAWYGESRTEQAKAYYASFVFGKDARLYIQLLRNCSMPRTIYMYTPFCILQLLSLSSETVYLFVIGRTKFAVLFLMCYALPFAFVLGTLDGLLSL